jgi:ABC-type multidrug transport system ATPase subunit
MDEIEHVSDDIAIIDGGKIILHDSKEAILTHADTALINVEQMGEPAVKELQQIDGIQVENDCIHIKRDGRFNENMATVFTILRAQGVRVKNVVVGHGTLEEIFLKLTNIKLRDDN